MARTSNPNSATSQFFINHADNSKSLDTYGGGYAVFGKVIDGHRRRRRHCQGEDDQQSWSRKRSGRADLHQEPSYASRSDVRSGKLGKGRNDPLTLGDVIS